MKHLIVILIIVTCFFPMSNYAVSAINDEYRNQYVDLLKKGNIDEKKLALNKAWFFLQSKDYGKDFRLLEPLLEALRDKNPSIRETAAVSLRNIEGLETKKKLVPFLIDALTDKNPKVRQEAAVTLAGYKDSRALEPLLKLLDDEDPWVRLSGVFALGELRYNGSFNSLFNILKSDNADWRNKFIQQECMIAIRKIESPTEIGKSNLLTVLRKKFDDPYLRAGITKTLGHFRYDESSDLLMIAARDSSEMIRKLSIEAMSRMPSFGLPTKNNVMSVGDPRVDICIKALSDPAVSVKLQAIAAINLLRDNRPVEPLINILNDKNEHVRNNAIDALGNFTDERILDVMIANFEKTETYYGNMSLKTFLSVARKTCKKTVHVYKDSDVMSYSSSEGDISRQIQSEELIVHPRAVGKLLSAFNNKEHNDKNIIRALSRFDDERIFSSITKDFDKKPAWFKREVIKILSHTDNDQAFPFLIKALKDQDNDVKKEAIFVLDRSREKRAIEPLMGALNDKNDDLRVAALNALMNFDEPQVLDLCYLLLRDNSPSVRKAAVLYITKKPDKKSIEYLINILEGPDSYLASCAAGALGVIKDERAVAPLIKVLSKTHTNNSVHTSGTQPTVKTARMLTGTSGGIKVVPADETSLKINAAMALGKIGDRKAVPALIECFSNKENDKFLRQEAAIALKHIGDPVALAAIEGLPEDRIKEFEPARPAIKAPIPPAPPKREMPRNIPGYPRLE